MEQKIDYFTRKINENKYQTNRSFVPPKKWISYTTFLIVIITIVVLMFILFVKYDSIKKIFDNSSSTGNLNDILQSEYKIGQVVDLSWSIFSDGDLVSYTHTLHTIDGDILWLKSRTLSLNDYQWNIYVKGIIEKLIGDMFVVEVNNISWSLLLQNTWTLSTGKYISEAWIFFDQIFFDNYFIESVDNWEIIVKNLDTNQLVTISYFKCNTSNLDQNCRVLNETFSQTSEKDFTTSNGVSFYKLQSVNSRYFSNDSLIWYFINDVSESELMKISDYIILLNRNYINDNMMFNILSICNNWSIGLDRSDSYDIILENNKIMLTVKWIYQTWNVICKISVDPLLPLKASLQSIDLDQTTTSVNSQWTVLTRDPKVKQFPINLDKTMDFASSSRWYKITFPSRNISFASTNVQQDFWQLGVNCFTQMNVVSYPNKENLQTNPAIKIYECNIKKSFQESDQIILKKLWDRNFVVEIIDPSWIEFANNLVIQ